MYIVRGNEYMYSFNPWHVEHNTELFYIRGAACTVRLLWRSAVHLYVVDLLFLTYLCIMSYVQCVCCVLYVVYTVVYMYMYECFVFVFRAIFHAVHKLVRV